MVAVALTGFSSGCGHGSRSDDSGGPHGSSSGGLSSGAAYDSGVSTGGSGGDAPTDRSTLTASPSSQTAPPLKDGTAVLVSCASPDDPYATVEVRNPNGRDAVFTVKISFKDKQGFTMIDTGDQVSVPAKDTTTYRRAMASAGRLDEIARCEVNPRATADR
ncbi:hypothetical protein ACFZAV_22000 [Streptomyces sp. NPDC008343]|uniref:hypothetical protein n=1 Tax=Streptomyces sp. NPDC008343 TaxID=3364828 RepID=UPI0036E024BA